MNRNQELSDLAAALREIAARLDALAEPEEPMCEQPASEQPASEQLPEPAEPAAAACRTAPTLTFPLNDRYRFMRELFGNSAARFNEVIAELAVAADEAAALSLLEGDGVDVDSETGKEFIAAVAAQIAK